MATKLCCMSKIVAGPQLRFQYGKKKNGQWYWRLRARNSEIIANGEGYKRKAGALRVHKLLFVDVPLVIVEEV